MDGQSDRGTDEQTDGIAIASTALAKRRAVKINLLSAFLQMQYLEWFPVKKGVQQRCVLSPYLFNILAEMVMRETHNGFQDGYKLEGE